MWRVWIRGTWHPVQSEAEIAAWVRQGQVGPETPIQHTSWPNPNPLGQVPNFAPMFAQRNEARPRPPGMGIDKKTLLITGWVFGAAIVYFILAAGGPALAVSAVLVGVSSIAIVVVGKLTVRSPEVVRTIAGTLWRWRAPWAVWSAVFLFGGGTALARQRSRVAECNRYVTHMSAIKSEALPYDDAMKLDILFADAEKGRGVCLAAGMTSQAAGMTSQVAALQAAKDEIVRQKAAGQRAAQEERARQDAAAEKAAQEERERRAVASYPDRAKDIKAKLAEAATKATAGMWIAADDALDKAQRILDEFNGTSVGGSDAWIGLSKQLDAQRERVEPQADKIRAREEAQRRKAAEKEEAEQQAQSLVDQVRGPKPGQWFDGCCFECREYLKRAMNDPDSYECVSSTQPQIEGPYWTVLMQFRGTNAFGAKVVNTERFFIQGRQVVKTED
jgi:hypothetical protein